MGTIVFLFFFRTTLEHSDVLSLRILDTLRLIILFQLSFISLLWFCLKDYTLQENLTVELFDQVAKGFWLLVSKRVFNLCEILFFWWLILGSGKTLTITWFSSVAIDSWKKWFVIFLELPTWNTAWACGGTPKPKSTLSAQLNFLFWLKEFSNTGKPDIGAVTRWKCFELFSLALAVAIVVTIFDRQKVCQMIDLLWLSDLLPYIGYSY